jgi:hypothetical protein
MEGEAGEGGSSLGFKDEVFFHRSLSFMAGPPSRATTMALANPIIPAALLWGVLVGRPRDYGETAKPAAAFQ